MDPTLLVAVATLALFVGVMAGCTGVGGVLAPPALVVLLGIEVHHAVAAGFTAYVFFSITTVVLYTRENTIRWKMALPICLAAAPAGFLGGIVVWWLPGQFLMLAIVALVLFGVWRAFHPDTAAATEDKTISAPRLVFYGGVAAFPSTLGGAAGPIILIPLLLMAGVTPLTAIGLGQVVSLVVSMTASAGHFVAGEIDYLLVLILACGMVVGTVIGSRLAHVLPLAMVRKFLGFAMLAIALMMLVQVIRDFLA